MDITADAARRPPPDDMRDVAAGRVDWTPKDVLFGIFWFIGAFILAPVPLTLPVLLATSDDSTAFYATSLVLSMAAQAALIAIAAAFTFRKYGGRWERLGLHQPDWSTIGWAAAAVIAAFAAAAVYAGIIELFDVDALRSERDDQLPDKILDTPALMVLAGIAVIAFAPLCEEVFFRGFVFPGLGRAWGAWAGIAVSALLWSLAHISPNIYKTLVPIFAIGLVFGFVYWRSGNLVSTVLAHLVFNVLSFAQLAGGSD
jgi:membrane protease YdiL (CAAX protease family)